MGWACGEEHVRVDRVMRRDVHAVVEVAGRAEGVAGIADIAEDRAGGNYLAGADIGVAVEMSVVVHDQGGSDHLHHPPAQAVRADRQDDASRGADDGRSARREDVDSLVPPPLRPRRTPGVDERLFPHAHHRNADPWRHRSTPERVENVRVAEKRVCNDCETQRREHNDEEHGERDAAAHRRSG
jgi:hypothetical protein